MTPGRKAANFFLAIRIRVNIFSKEHFTNIAMEFENNLEDIFAGICIVIHIKKKLVYYIL
jgi:hypothetical protein